MVLIYIFTFNSSYHRFVIDIDYDNDTQFQFFKRTVLCCSLSLSLFVYVHTYAYVMEYGYDVTVGRTKSFVTFFLKKIIVPYWFRVPNDDITQLSLYSYICVCIRFFTLKFFFLLELSCI